MARPPVPPAHRPRRLARLAAASMLLVSLSPLAGVAAAQAMDACPAGDGQISGAVRVDLPEFDPGSVRIAAFLDEGSGPTCVPILGGFGEAPDFATGAPYAVAGLGRGPGWAVLAWIDDGNGMWDEGEPAAFRPDLDLSTTDASDVDLLIADGADDPCAGEHDITGTVRVTGTLPEGAPVRVRALSDQCARWGGFDGTPDFAAGAPYAIRGVPGGAWRVEAWIDLDADAGVDEGEPYASQTVADATGGAVVDLELDTGAGEGPGCPEGQVADGEGGCVPTDGGMGGGAQLAVTTDPLYAKAMQTEGPMGTPPTQSVTVTVLDEADAPIPGASVSAWLGPGQTTQTTDEAGQATFDVPVGWGGSYHFQASTDSAWGQGIFHVLGQEDGLVRVTARGPDGAPVEGIHVDAYYTEMLGADNDGSADSPTDVALVRVRAGNHFVVTQAASSPGSSAAYFFLHESVYVPPQKLVDLQTVPEEFRTLDLQVGVGAEAADLTKVYLKADAYDYRTAYSLGGTTSGAKTIHVSPGVYDLLALDDDETGDPLLVYSEEVDVTASATHAIAVPALGRIDPDVRFGGADEARARVFLGLLDLGIGAEVDVQPGQTIGVQPGQWGVLGAQVNVPVGAEPWPAWTYNFQSGAEPVFEQVDAGETILFPLGGTLALSTRIHPALPVYKPSDRLWIQPVIQDDRGYRLQWISLPDGQVQYDFRVRGPDGALVHSASGPWGIDWMIPADAAEGAYTVEVSADVGPLGGALSGADPIEILTPDFHVWTQLDRWQYTLGQTMTLNAQVSTGGMGEPWQPARDVHVGHKLYRDGQDGEAPTLVATLAPVPTDRDGMARATFDIGDDFVPGQYRLITNVSRGDLVGFSEAHFRVDLFASDVLADRFQYQADAPITLTARAFRGNGLGIADALANLTVVRQGDGEELYPLAEQTTGGSGYANWSFQLSDEGEYQARVRFAAPGSGTSTQSAWFRVKSLDLQSWVKQTVAWDRTSP